MKTLLMVAFMLCLAVLAEDKVELKQVGDNIQVTITVDCKDILALKAKGVEDKEISARCLARVQMFLNNSIVASRKTDAELDSEVMTMKNNVEALKKARIIKEKQ